MRILYLAHRPPFPPTKGDKIRACNQIRGLAERHTIHLLALADGPEEAAAADGLRQWCETVEIFPRSWAAAPLRYAAALLTGAPLTLAHFHSRALAKRVSELAREGGFDIVVASTTAMAPYAALVPGRLPRYLDMVDVDSEKWARYARFSGLPVRLIYAREARSLRAYEARLAREFDGIGLITSREALVLRSFAPSARVTVITNGVRSDVFRPLEVPRSEAPSLIFTGQMDYLPNVDGMVRFARRVFPRLRLRFPELELTIVGRSPVASILALERIPGVMVTGSVVDVHPFLGRSWIFVAPLRIAQGLQNKILEAMACQIPVVCSRECSEGLADGGFESGVDLFAGEDDAAIEEAIARLLSDESLRHRVAAAGRRRTLEMYSWERAGRELEDLLCRLSGQELPLCDLLAEPAARAG